MGFNFRLHSNYRIFRIHNRTSCDGSVAWRFWRIFRHTTRVSRQIWTQLLMFKKLGFQQTFWSTFTQFLGTENVGKTKLLESTEKTRNWTLTRRRDPQQKIILVGNVFIVVKRQRSQHTSIQLLNFVVRKFNGWNFLCLTNSVSLGRYLLIIFS